MEVVSDRVRPLTTTSTSQRSSSAWTWSLASLPPDLLEQSCKRIAIVAMVFAGLWMLPLVLNPVALRFAPDDPFVAGAAWPMPGRLIAGLGLLLSLGMVFVAAKLHPAPSVLLNTGLGFEVATALLIGILNQWQPVLVPGRASWICIIILIYPAIVPNTPTKTFIAAFAAASMDPLGFGIAMARGAVPAGEFTAFTALWYFLPAYLCAALAVVPVHIIRKLGRQVSKARELGSYRLGESIGTGGMGDVYRAEHRLLARPAAIKLIRPALLSTSRREATVILERFRREAEAAALLRSPHTIELYDFGVAEEGTFYLVMELLDGLSFEVLVERFGPVPPERAVYLMLQACASLAEAHSTGLMHRDIKPSNIFTNRLGLEVDFVKVLDFGLVKADPGNGVEQSDRHAGVHGAGGRARRGDRRPPPRRILAWGGTLLDAHRSAYLRGIQSDQDDAPTH